MPPQETLKHSKAGRDQSLVGVQTLQKIYPSHLAMQKTTIGHPAVAGGFFTREPTGKPCYMCFTTKEKVS